MAMAGKCCRPNAPPLASTPLCQTLIAVLTRPLCFLPCRTCCRVRFLLNGSLALLDPQPLPGSDALRLRRLAFRGSLLELEARRGTGWTLALSSTSPATAPPLMLLPATAGASAVPLERGRIIHMNGSATIGTVVPDI